MRVIIGGNSPSQKKVTPKMLTDTACKNAHWGGKAKWGKVFKLADGKGLSFGCYPDIA
ncbi:MAG: hypothetical protein ABL933_00405 [Methyloglobulus sp.]|nr:hypothetical protein [Methyloglobulus sp.]